MKRILLFTSLLAAVVAAALIVVRTNAKSRAEAADSSQMVRVSRRDLASVVKATGVIKPMVGAEVRVGSRASGIVKRLLVRIGDRVQQGQLLAELESRELIARRDAAEAGVQQAEANLNYTAIDLRRKRELSDAKVISRAELDLAIQAHEVAEQQHEQAEANLADAKTLLGYTRIVAPFSGVVESVTTQEGETVAASLAAPTFVTLLDTSRLEVRAYVDETDIGRVQVGMAATFTVDTYPDFPFVGRVTAIYPQAEIRDNVVNYITVINFLPAPNHTLRPEMTTTVRVALDERKQVLALPLRVIRHEEGRSFVMTRKGDTTERRFIKTGLRDDTYCEILDGLREGDEVLAAEKAKK
jgi:macrolide-specific efflux system membrane fusion protein